jgi:plasmid segregation protein ParM
MKKFQNAIIIGVDHGYGNCKTANCIFQSGVVKLKEGQEFAQKPLIYKNEKYLVGQGHKVFVADKFLDEDYYILTLAAIAEELSFQGITTADVHIAAGVPLTWLGSQAKEFKSYLLQNNTVDFTYKDKEYHINIVGADIFPQGFSAIAKDLYMFKGANILADIGNGTINIMHIIDQKPDVNKCFTEKFGTEQCTIRINERIMQTFHIPIHENIITEVLRFGTADIAEKYLKVMQEEAREYTKEIFERLKIHEYNAETMKLHIVGGGGCLIKNFGEYDKSRVFINDDINATAKGYEYLAELNMRKGGGKK